MLRFITTTHTLRFHKPAMTSRGLLSQRTVQIITVVDAQQPEITGMGECGPVPGLSIDDRPDFARQVEIACARLTAGRLNSPTLEQAAAILAHHADLTPAVLPSFYFGLETALRDLATGGRQRLWDTPFSRGDVALRTHGLIWMDSPEALLAQIEHKVASGHRVIKLKVGALPWGDELALLRRVRVQWPANELELRLDANGAFGSPAEAEARLVDLAPLAIHYLEQPLPAHRLEELAWLCRRSPVPLVLDETLIGVDPAAAPALLHLIRPAGIIVKPALLGGFTAAEGWVAAAQALGMDWWANSLLESNIGLNAICQWTAHVDPTGATVHGLGTGQLFVENLPAPVRLVGAELWCDE